MPAEPLAFFSKANPSDVLIVDVFDMNMNLNISRFPFEDNSVGMVDIFEIIFTTGEKLVCSKLSLFNVTDKKNDEIKKIKTCDIDVDNHLLVFGQEKMKIKSIEFIHNGILKVKQISSVNILFFDSFMK